MLSAYQARQMMPNKNATKLVEYILSGVPARAKNGYYDITVGCPDTVYTEHDIEVAETQLKNQDIILLIVMGIMTFGFY